MKQGFRRSAIALTLEPGLDHAPDYSKAAVCFPFSVAFLVASPARRQEGVWASQGRAAEENSVAWAVVSVGFPLASVTVGCFLASVTSFLANLDYFSH